MLKKIIKSLIGNLSTPQIAGVMRFIKKQNPDLHKAIVDAQEAQKAADATKGMQNQVRNALEDEGIKVP